jgi:glyoxylate reductase
MVSPGDPGLGTLTRAVAVDILTSQQFPNDVIQPFTARFAIDQGPPGGLMPYDEMRVRVAASKALLPTSIDRVDAALIEGADALRVIANVGVGYNHIDVAAATRRGIWVTNTPGVLTESVADLTMALLLGTLRRVSEASEHVRHGHWTDNRQDLFWGTDLRELTLGILGLGAIGQAVARRAAPFGPRIIYHKRTRLGPDVEDSLGVRYVSFEELIETSDVLSLHVPLTDETRGCIGRAELARVRPGSFIINVARGPVVDEAALFDALESGHVAGVGLDVTSTEPDVPVKLRGHPRALILPHIASATRGTRGGMMRMALENAAAVLDGQRPPNAVNEIS